MSDPATAVEKLLAATVGEAGSLRSAWLRDELFHAAVTAAGHSALLARLMAEISDLIKETRIESLSQPERPLDSLHGHRRVAEAIRARDPEAAAQAMQEHIAMVSDVALLRS
jgi:GntR family transcriptional regulator, transcriptional repressor for pyruvate dehydrogenase complex